MSELSHSPEYLSFRANIPRRKICVDSDGRKEWILYDIGPKSISSPLICFPPVSGRADIYFQQMLTLSSTGFRVISVEYPTYWTVQEFCEGFQQLLNHLQLDRVHLFGSSVGGFLAQKFAEFSLSSHRVESLILCNTFTSTDIFDQTISAPTFWMLPAVMLKSMVMGNLDKGNTDLEIAKSIEFVVCSLDSLGQKELASRLTLNCRNCKVDTKKLRELSVTIIDVNDDCAVSQTVKDEMYKSYPNARLAHLKSGANFPYLSRAAEVNLYLQIHLRQFCDTKYSAMEPEMEETNIDADVPAIASSLVERKH